MPPGVALEDGLTEEEAVALALWNNSAYQALLAELGITRAQLVEAGLLTDPLFMTFLPLGPKQLEFTLILPLEAVWLRPIRLRAAQLDLARVSQQMVQHGLNVIRDTRVAHAELLLAQQQAALASEALGLREEIAELAERRLAAGDISELELTSAKLDAIQAKADAVRAAADVAVVENRLTMLVGLPLQNPDLIAVETQLPDTANSAAERFDAEGFAAEELVGEAFALRPDLRAAEISVEANRERARLARRQFMTLAGIVDANSRGTKGFEAGPGLQMTIPIFNRNRGGIALADARLRQSVQEYVSARDRVAVEVRGACLQLEQAHGHLAVVERELLPSLETAVELARRSYENGAAPYFLVLQTSGQFLGARARELELQASRRRAIAELERSVGRRFYTWPRRISPELLPPPSSRRSGPAPDTAPSTDG